MRRLSRGGPTAHELRDILYPVAQPVGPLPTFDRTPNSATEVSDPALVSRPRLEAQAPSRRGKKALIGYFDPGVSKQLKLLALEEDSTVQQLLGEALDLLFQARGKPRITQALQS